MPVFKNHVRRGVCATLIPTGRVATVRIHSCLLKLSNANSIGNVIGTATETGTQAATEITETNYTLWIVVGVVLVLACCVCMLGMGQSEDKRHRDKFESAQRENNNLGMQVRNLRQELSIMEKAYTQLKEQKNPEQMQPLIKPPEQKLFWVADNTSCLNA